MGERVSAILAKQGQRLFERPTERVKRERERTGADVWRVRRIHARGIG